jgi:two-component system, NarL family, response regulator NreC
MVVRQTAALRTAEVTARSNACNSFSENQSISSHARRRLDPREPTLKLIRVNKPLRILLVEDHETVRQGLKLLLDREADFEVVEEASDGTEVFQRGRLDGLDVVVMDLSMPGMSGLVATRKLKEMRPDLPVVTLTRHADETFLQELLRAGASGYVLKQSPHAELFRAIRAVASGQQYVDPALTHHLAAPFAAHAKRSSARTPAITDRESEVLRLVAQGHSNKEIANQLSVSVKTIEVHKANAMRKLALHGRIDLVRYALHQGWLHDA